MRVGLDIDGVIRPWHTSMYRYFQIFKGYEGDEYEFWNYFRELPKEKQDYYVSIPLMYLDTMPTKDALTYVPKLAEIADIYYVTSCPLHLEWATLKFFDMYNLPFKENIVFSSDKATNVRLLKLEYFLDDLAHNVDAVKDLTNAYMFKASHNRDTREGRKVVSSIKEFYDIIKER